MCIGDHVIDSHWTHPTMPPLSCTFPGCVAKFRRQSGRTYHIRTVHHTNNIVEEVDVQANVHLGGQTLAEGEGILRHVDDSDPDPDFDMHDNTPAEPHADPAPADERPRRPVEKTHPYLDG